MVSVVRITGKKILRIDYDTEYADKARIENLSLWSPTSDVIKDWVKDSESGTATTLTQEEFMQELIVAQNKIEAALAA